MADGVKGTSVKERLASLETMSEVQGQILFKLDANVDKLLATHNKKPSWGVSLALTGLTSACVAFATAWVRGSK